MSDRVDEWMLSSLTEFEGKKLQSVAKGDLDLGKLEDEAEKEAQKKVEDEAKPLVEKIQSVLTDKVKEVRVTHRLTDSPACLVSGENELSGNLERLLKAAGQKTPDTKPTLEINTEHKLVKRLSEANDTERFADLVHVLFDQALLAEGGQLDDPASFVKRMNSLII